MSCDTFLDIATVYYFGFVAVFLVLYFKERNRN